ncbi:MAG: carbon monoxide dehydrogenase [Alphaproteobacteria bacterium]|nr:MAG: carbon monoxide dehydrogenase [Alphaproteobacteria bacterium]
MKAPAIDYVRPRSLTEAIDLLARSGGEGRVIAGGQSLVAMMNLRVASPGLLIDIARLPELTAATDEGDTVTLGACVTHAAIEDGRIADPSRGLMPRVAATLAYRAIRTRGTVGGSLALSDPAAEWPAVLSALDAEVLVCGPDGRRSIRCAELMTGVFETTLAADEIIEGVRIPRLSAEACWGYLKLCRKAGEFASALAVVVSDRKRSHSRVVLGGLTARRWCCSKHRELSPRMAAKRSGTPLRPISTVQRTGTSTNSSAISIPSLRCAQCNRCCSDCDPPAGQRCPCRG